MDDNTSGNSGIAKRIPSDDLYVELSADGKLNSTYFALSIASATIATLGLLENSTAVIIGAMIIAPLLMPIQGIAFGVLHARFTLVRQAFITLMAGIFVALSVSYVLGILFRFETFGSEVAARTYPTILDLGIALAAGSIGGYAKVNRKLSSSVAGTAIAVALMPPLCVVGIEFARANLVAAGGAFLLFFTNVLGITLACMLAYIAGGYANFHQARLRLLGMVGAVLLLILPLGSNLMRLLRETNVETAIRASLDQTVTFSHVTVVALKMNWLKTPPDVRVDVLANHEITPTQVELVEQFVQRRTGIQVHLHVGVTQVQEVTNAAPNETPSVR
jgi:uncharacterized hydrophobic protein (TIGR00271 family)